MRETDVSLDPIETDLAQRLDFLGIGDAQRRALRDFWPLVRPVMPAIAEAFYHHITAIPALAALIDQQVPCLKPVLVAHWERLFSGRFDRDYVDSVRAIGQVHHRAGLSPRWYIGSYNFILGRLTSIAVRQDGWTDARKDGVIAAVTGAVMLELDIAISVYTCSALERARTRQAALDADQSRHRIARLLSGLPAAVYCATLDADGAVRAFSPTETVTRITGWTPDEVVDWDSWCAHIQGTVGDSRQAHLRALIAGGEDSSEYAFRHKDGSIRRLRDQARVVDHRSDGGVDVVGAVFDITRDHAIRTQAMASSKLATLGEMATGLAHEMNQPIAIMALAAENVAHVLARKGADGIEFSLKRLARIKEQAVRARTIVDHLRIFGRRDNGTCGPVAVAGIVDGALAMVGSALRGSSIDVRTAIDPALPPVTAILVLAEQVMVNLVLNARDAMDTLPPDARRLLDIRAWKDAGSGLVTLEIGDSGPGIPPALRGRVFEPFFTTKEAGKGTGLGLSICQGIMGSFGGGIDVRDGAGGGTVFALTFRPA